MMKRNILAVIVPALLAAGAANAAEIYNKDGNKLDIYGKVQAGHYFGENDNNEGDKTYVRFGLKGETQITDQLIGYGNYQTELSTGNGDYAYNEGSDKMKTRLAFAGLKFANYGTFDYGRNWGIVYDVEGWTDVLPEFGGDSYTSADNFMNGRASSVATYRNKGFFGLVDGLNMGLQVQGKNEGGSKNLAESARKVDKQNGDGVGYSLTYATDIDLTFGAAYSNSDRTDGQETTLAQGARAEAYTLGAKYDHEGIYLAAMYAETRNQTRFGDVTSNIANKTQNIELVAQYQFDFGLQPSLAWVYSKGKDLGYTDLAGKGYDSEDLVNYVSVGSNYNFNKNFSAFVDYKINMIDSSDFTKAAGVNTDDTVAVGLVYQF